MTTEAKKELLLRVADELDDALAQRPHQGPLMVFTQFEARTIARVLREAAEGAGFLATFVQIGWRDHDGEQRFQGIIEFPDGPPSVPVLAVWNAWPFHFKAAPLPLPPSETTR